MPLISCPDCGRDVSTAAAACPGCGCPLGDSGPWSGPWPPPSPGRRVQTIQQTAKVFKLGILLGALVSIAGCTGFMVTTQLENAGQATPLAWGATFLAGLALFVLFRVLAWWFHG